ICFHLDEHFPDGIAEALQRHGVEAETTVDAGLLGASDVEHLDYARAHRQMVVTKDTDFLKLHGAGWPHDGIAFCSHDPHAMGFIGNVIEALLLLHAVYTAEEMIGRLEYI